MRGKHFLYLRFGFVIHFRERTFVFVVLMPPSVFQWCFAYVFAYLLGFLFPKMLGKHFLLLRFGFWYSFSGAHFCFCCHVAALCFSVVFCLCFYIFVGFFVPENAWQKFSSSLVWFLRSIFGSALLFLVSCCRLVFFSGVLPMFLHICWVFCSRKCLAKIIFFLGLVFEIHFREQIFVFVVLLLPCVFRWCFAYVFYLFVSLLVPKRLGKNCLFLRFGFWNPFSGANYCFCCLVTL